MADTLKPGDQLKLDETLTSKDGRFRVTMQADGNLVLYYTPKNVPTWASHTWQKKVTNAIMQADGNFVIYNGNAPLWASNTWNHPGSYLILQDDGNLVIYDIHNRPIWATNTGVPSEPDTGGCKIVTIISFVSGNPIHTERVTGPDLMKKVAKVLSDWGAYPYGQNGGEIRDC